MFDGCMLINKFADSSQPEHARGEISPSSPANNNFPHQKKLTDAEDRGAPDETGPAHFFYGRPIKMVDAETVIVKDCQRAATFTVDAFVLVGIALDGILASPTNTEASLLPDLIGTPIDPDLLRSHSDTSSEDGVSKALAAVAINASNVCCALLTSIHRDPARALVSTPAAFGVGAPAPANMDPVDIVDAAEKLRLRD